jgi:hypothetical protein
MVTLTPSFKNEVVHRQRGLGRRVGRLPLGEWYGERCRCRSHDNEKTKVVLIQEMHRDRRNSGEIGNDLGRDKVGIGESIYMVRRYYVMAAPSLPTCQVGRLWCGGNVGGKRGPAAGNELGRLQQRILSAKNPFLWESFGNPSWAWCSGLLVDGLLSQWHLQDPKQPMTNDWSSARPGYTFLVTYRG